MGEFYIFDVLRTWAKRRGMPTFDIWSSLFHNTSVRYEQHEYDTSNTGMTRVRHKQHSATRVRQECDTNKTNMARLRHKRHDCDMSGTFWFWNDTSENIFSFLKRLIFFFLKEFIILDFVNFPKKLHGWKLWRAINRELKHFAHSLQPKNHTFLAEKFTKSQ